VKDEVSVLLVEDVEEDIARVRDFLAGRGDLYDVARTVPEAIELLSRKQYQKVLLDVVIAGNVNGARLILEALKTRNPACRVLIVSDAGETAHVQRLRTDALVDGVITKRMMMDLAPVISKFLNDSAKSEATPPLERTGEDRRLAAPLVYAALAGTGLIIGIGMLFVLVRFSSAIPADGTADRIYYFILITFGLAVAAFLFGAMRSFASFRGKVLSGTLELGGPAAIFVLIVIGGFNLAPRNTTFTVTVRITDAQGQPIRGGSVTLRARAATLTAPINSNGEADFRELPAKLQATTARIVAEVPGYEQRQTEYKLESVVGLVLARKSP